MDEERNADLLADDAGHHIDRMVVRPEFDQPGSGAARARQFDVLAGQPNHQDLGLDRTLDIKTIREHRHRPILTPRPRLLRSRQGRIRTGVAAFANRDESVQIERPPGLVDVALARG